MERPDVFVESYKRNSLKPAGHAMAIQIARNKREQKNPTSRPFRILEIGHGSLSPFFEIISTDPLFECHGLDDIDKDKTVSSAALESLRKRYNSCRFHRGYMGDSDSLPSNYFDLVFSISVIEHVPKDQLQLFQQEIYRILVPGGEQFHSYDVPWGFDTSPMRNSIERAGFSWVETPHDCATLWSSAKISNVIFENAFVVTDLFQHAKPMTERKLYNWTTVFMNAKKPMTNV